MGRRCLHFPRFFVCGKQSVIEEESEDTSGRKVKVKMDNTLLTDQKGTSDTDQSTTDTTSEGSDTLSITSGFVSENEASSEHSASSDLPECVASKQMAVYCFEALMFGLCGLTKVPTPTFTNDPYRACVTWTVGENHELRGCRGSFEPNPLHTVLHALAISSSRDDPCHPPIRMDEVSDLHCCVSLMTDFQITRHCLDWEIGVHGVLTVLDSPQGPVAASFLPEIAKEQGWTKLQTIQELLKKAGCVAPVCGEVLFSLRLMRYRSEQVTASFQDYLHYTHTCLAHPGHRL